MSSRALLAPPGARRGAAASTKYVYDAQKPSEHRRGRNKPGVLKLLLPKVAGAALLCAAATYQVPRDTPDWHRCTPTAHPSPDACAYGLSVVSGGGFTHTDASVGVASCGEVLTMKSL